MTRWSQEQEAVFAAFADRESGNLVVRARAGTGKTTTIVEALARVPRGTKALLTAFNKKNAEELDSRLQFANARNAEAKTLHALGFGLVRGAARVRVDGGEGRRVARDVCGRAPGAIVTLVANLASKVKNCVVPTKLSLDAIDDVAWRFDLLPSREQEKAGWTASRVVRLVDDVLVRTTAKSNDPSLSIDFDDMVWLPLAWGLVRPSYDLVVVDEAQDMSPVQLALALGSCRESGRIVVVGDDRQAIYAFRGADSGALDRMKTELGARELALPTTYRCPSRVVELARALVPDYRAAEGARQGEVERVTPSRFLQNLEPGCYVLGRSNAAVVKACLEALRAGRPAEVAGRDIGRQIMSLVDDLAAGSAKISDILQRLEAWGAEEIRRIEAKAKGRDLDVDALVDAVEDKVATIDVLCDGLASVPELRTRVDSLFGDGAEGSKVTCSTVHRAKGMERDVVVILEDSLRSGRLEEENIRYVALTRTKRRLVLVSERYDDPGDVGREERDTEAW